MLIAMIFAAALYTKAVAPKPIDPVAWITSNDYPSEALRQGQEGVSAIRLSIDTKGAVTDCVIMASSGHELLDTQTCDLLRARGKFEPARDGAGKAMASIFDRRVRWQIPIVATRAPVESVLVQIEGGVPTCLVNGDATMRIKAQVCADMVKTFTPMGYVFPGWVSVGLSDEAIEKP